MIITCTECQASYRLADEKIKPGGTRVRCSACQHVFTVLPAAAVDSDDFVSPAAAAMPAATPPEPPVPPAAGSGGALGGGADEHVTGPPATDREPPPAPTPPAAAETFFTEETPFSPASSAADDLATERRDATAGETFGALAFTEGTDEDSDQFDFDQEAETADASMGLGGEAESGTAVPFASDTAFGEEWSSGWDQPETEASAFDFEEPHFEAEDEALKRGEAGLNFDEIEFTAPSSSEPLGIPPLSVQSGTSAAPPLTPAAPPLPTASRPPSEAPLPAASGTRPKSRALPLLMLLLILGGIAGYVFFTADGQQLVNRLLAKVTGGGPAVPAEQRIGLEVDGSSYVINREAGQLLVIQGSAVNNFAEARSALTVKGVILDAGGKVLQQQTAFCGNYLDDEQLRTYRYAQIEEAMNNQFGTSLANMNVKPGKAIPFTIVFRNVPKEMANIHVEVVDSKAGGL
jgi:predicted Zn finger-like uncharacterized protein